MKEAFDKGELSEQQANEVSKAAKADPKAQRRLVNRAKRSTLKSLKKDRDRVKHGAERDPQRAAQAHPPRAAPALVEELRRFVPPRPASPRQGSR